MRSKYSEVPWEEVDGASFFYSKNHYAPVGRDLMEWSVAAFDWIDEVFPRDVRVRKSMRKFIPVFLHHVESDKLTTDGRQFALLPLKTIMEDMDVAKPTAKETVDRFTLSGKYEAMRADHSPILEVVEETVPGARAGEWGYGYAPVMDSPENPGSLSPDGAEPGSEKTGNIEPGMGEAGSVSGDAGSVSAGPGSASRDPGSETPKHNEPSVCTELTDSSASEKTVKDFDAFLRLFPKGAGTKLVETQARYEEVVGFGVTPESLYDAADRHMREIPEGSRSVYPLHFLNRTEVLESLRKSQPWSYQDARLTKLPGAGWIYLFPSGNEYVTCPQDTSRPDARNVVIEMAREKGLV